MVLSYLVGPPDFIFLIIAGNFQLPPLFFLFAPLNENFFSIGPQ